MYGDAFKEKMDTTQCIQALYKALTERMPVLTFVPLETFVALALANETLVLLPEPVMEVEVEVEVVVKPKKEGAVVKLVHKDAQDCGLG